MQMPTILDSELGKITIRKSARSKHIRMRVAPDGTIRVSAPFYSPLFLIKRTIAASRDELHQLLHRHRPTLDYQDGDQIGKSHSLVVRDGTAISVKRQGLRIIVTKPAALPLDAPEIQPLLRKEIITALRREAKGYLPKRLKYLADQHGFRYERVRFSHASGRWGSCSSTGTISLNIALMKLPFALIDYVLVHELSHTIEMNHSDQFWDLVGKYDPEYPAHRAALKKEVPTI